LRNALRDFDRNNYLSYAGALAFFFLLAVFPLFIFLASLLAYVPIPNLFGHIVDTMSRIVPEDAMGVVRGVLHNVLSTNKELLSGSILGAVFAASGGFTALITILNIAYDVREGRPYWKKRLPALGLTLLTGVMVTAALVAMALGPRFGLWLSSKLAAGWVFAALWPYIRWAAVAAFTVLSVETIYFLAPNIKQKFTAQVPGAVLAVLSWIAASWALGWYIRNFAHYNKTFGALGAVVALMLWFYTTAIAIIFGAELNSELVHATGNRLLQKEGSETYREMQRSRDREPRRKIA
jgi:membrane protein